MKVTVAETTEPLQTGLEKTFQVLRRKEKDLRIRRTKVSCKEKIATAKVYCNCDPSSPLLTFLENSL